MNRLSNGKTIENTTPSLPPTNIQSVENQKSHSSRASNAISQNDFYNKYTGQSCFERLCTYFPELISEILCNCTLQNVLTLRLVSKGLYESSRKLGLLAQKAAVTFEYNSLQIKTSFIQEKLNFAIQENVDINLKLQNVLQVNQQWTAFFNASTPQFLSKIKGLDINNFNITQRTSDSINLLFGTISKNVILFPNLKSLILGHLCPGHQLIIPNDLASKLQYFTIDRGLCKNTVYIMPNSSTNLLTISIGNLEDGSHFQLPSSLPHLTRLSFGNIGKNVTIILPTSFDNLTTIKTGNISDDATRQLFNSLTGPENSKIAIIQKQLIKTPNFNPRNIQKKSENSEICIIS